MTISKNTKIVIYVAVLLLVAVAASCVFFVKTKAVPQVRKVVENEPVLQEKSRIAITLIDNLEDELITNKNIKFLGTADCRFKVECVLPLIFEGVTNNNGIVYVDENTFNYRFFSIEVEGYYINGPFKKQTGSTIFTRQQPDRTKTRYDYKKDEVIIRIKSPKSAGIKKWKTYTSQNPAFSFEYPSEYGSVAFKFSTGDTGKTFSGHFSNNNNINFRGTTPDYTAPRSTVFSDMRGYTMKNSKYNLKGFGEFEPISIIENNGIEIVVLDARSKLDDRDCFDNNKRCLTILNRNSLGAITNIKHEEFPALTFSVNDKNIISQNEFESLLKTLKLFSTEDVSK